MLALASVLGAGDRAVEGRARLVSAARAKQQLGADDVPAVVLLKRERKPVDDCERGVRPVDLGHGDRPVECDDRRGIEGEEVVVELHDLPPVGGIDRGRVGVDGRDRGLQLERPGPVLP